MLALESKTIFSTRCYLNNILEFHFNFIFPQIVRKVQKNESKFSSISLMVRNETLTLHSFSISWSMSFNIGMLLSKISSIIQLIKCKMKAKLKSKFFCIKNKLVYFNQLSLFFFLLINSFTHLVVFILSILMNID